MDPLLFALTTLAVGVTGIIITLLFVLLPLFRRSPKHWRRVLFSFLASSALVLLLILMQELILYPPNPRSEQLVLSAFREAPIGGYWLGLYNDSTWELGNSSREIKIKGGYSIVGDTLDLTTVAGTTFQNGSTTNRILIGPKYLVEIENTGIVSLEITLNKLDN